MRALCHASLAALTVSAALSSPAALAEEMVDATDPQKLVSVIRNLGYRAELERDEVGDPLIRSSVGGTRFAIVFYGCDTSGTTIATSCCTRSATTWRTASISRSSMNGTRHSSSAAPIATT